MWQIWCQSVQPFGSIPRFLHYCYLAHYPLEMNLHVCARFGPDRTTGDDV